MADSKSLKDEINALIPPALKAKFQAVFSRFNLPPTPPATQPPVAPQAPTTLTEAALADGTVIKYDTPQLAQGSVVTIVTPEGEMAMPEGEHKLADGTTIKVISKDGKSVVESVTPGQMAPPAEPAQQAAEPNPAEQIVAIQKVLQGYKDQFLAAKTENESLIKKIEAQGAAFTALKKDVVDFMSVFNELVQTPSAQPLEQPKNKHAKKFSSDGLTKFINRTI